MRFHVTKYKEGNRLNKITKNYMLITLDNFMYISKLILHYDYSDGV